MRRATIVLVCLVSLGAPQAAQAGWQIDRATAIARIVWHNPCVDRMQIRWAPQPAEITYAALAWAEPTSCTVTLNSRIHLRWGDVCYELLHEAGHLAGYYNPVGIEPLEGGPMDHDHSPDSRSIMYPSPSTINNDGHIPASANWRCRGRGRQFLSSHR